MKVWWVRSGSLRYKLLYQHIISVSVRVFPSKSLVYISCVIWLLCFKSVLIIFKRPAYFEFIIGDEDTNDFVCWLFSNYNKLVDHDGWKPPVSWHGSTTIIVLAAMSGWIPSYLFSHSQFWAKKFWTWMKQAYFKDVQY